MIFFLAFFASENDSLTHKFSLFLESLGILVEFPACGDNDYRGDDFKHIQGGSSLLQRYDNP